MQSGFCLQPQLNNFWAFVLKISKLERAWFIFFKNIFEFSVYKKWIEPASKKNFNSLNFLIYDLKYSRHSRNTLTLISSVWEFASAWVDIRIICFPKIPTTIYFRAGKLCSLEIPGFRFLMLSYLNLYTYSDNQKTLERKTTLRLMLWLLIV